MPTAPIMGSGGYGGRWAHERGLAESFLCIIIQMRGKKLSI